jgi:glycosyltransferase involved in cell wall biosynthesis
MKKILVITYYWPPSGGSGVQRWMYFCKYLSEFGYEPIVLTVNEKKASYKFRDEQFSEFVKDIRAYRTTTFEPLKLYSLLTTRSTTSGMPHGNVNQNKKGIFFKVSNYIRGNFFIPDARIGWNRHAYRKGKVILQNEDIHAVITTGPPHSTHLIGRRLKRNFNTKWIADFRDPWSEIYYNKDLMRSKNTVRKDLSLESSVLNEADLILTVGQKMKELLWDKVDKLNGKFHHIYNGFDSIKMELTKREEQDFFEITFIGSLSDNQPYKSIIDTIQGFMESRKSDGKNVKLCLAGNIQKQIVKEFRDELTNVEIDFYGYIDHNRSLELMKRSQLLINCLVEMENSQILISGKQMEYIATGNPILSIGNKQGEAANLLSNIVNAKACEKGEITEMINFVRSIYKYWAKNEPLLNKTDNPEIMSMSRYETTRQLAQLLVKI